MTTLEKAGEVHLARGDVDAAKVLLEQALALTRQLCDSHGEASVTGMLSELHKHTHNSFTTIRRYPLLAR